MDSMTMENTSIVDETSPSAVDCLPFVVSLFPNETTLCRPVSSGFESSFISRHRTAITIVCLTAVVTSLGFNVILISRLIQRPAGIIASARNALLLNLAMADVLLSLTYNAFMLQRILCERWPLGAPGCRAYGFGLDIFGCVRNATLSLFSIERILFIDRKLNEVKNQSQSQFPVNVMRDREFKKYACLLVTSSWLLSLVLTLPLLAGSSAFEVDPHSLICALNSSNRDVLNVCYRLAFFIVGCLLPLSLNYGTYRAFGDKVDHIVRLLEQKNRRQSSLIRLAVRVSHNSRLSTVSRRSVSSVSSVVLRDLNRSSKRRPLTDEVIAEKHVTRLLTVMGAVSTLSALPYGLLAVSTSLAEASQAEWLTLTSGLYVLMSSLHPIVLLLFSDQLKLRCSIVLCRKPLSATVSVFPDGSLSSRDNRKLTARTTRFHSAPNASFCGSPLPRSPLPPLSPLPLTPITEANSFALFSASPAAAAAAILARRPASASDTAGGRLSLTDIRSASPAFSSATLSPFPSPGAASRLSPALAASPAATAGGYRPSPTPKVERFFGESHECIRSRDNSITPTLAGRLHSSGFVGQEVEGWTTEGGADERTMFVDSMEHSRTNREKQTIAITHQTNKLDERQLPYVA